jgi:Phosphofructokinase
MPKKRIGILTGGGDVPGLNSVIKSVTYRSSENGIEVLGLRRGWEGLTHLNLDDPGPSTGAEAPCCTPAEPTQPECGSSPVT